MFRERLLTMALVALGSAATVRAADGWARLKAGMTREQAVAAIGNPVLLSRGHGIERWIYDGGAEVVSMRGTVVAWTAPAGRKTTRGRQIDVSQLRPSQPVPASKSEAVAANMVAGEVAARSGALARL